MSPCFKTCHLHSILNTPYDLGTVMWAKYKKGDLLDKQVTVTLVGNMIPARSG